MSHFTNLKSVLKKLSREDLEAFALSQGYSHSYVCGILNGGNKLSQIAIPVPEGATKEDQDRMESASENVARQLQRMYERRN